MKHLSPVIVARAQFEIFNVMFEFNPNSKIEFHRFGHEEQPILVIDDLILDPEKLVELAINRQWNPPNAGLYPGIIAEPPEQYLYELAAKLKPNFCRAFNFPSDKRLSATGFFALTTKGLKDFGPWQRIPHFDQSDTDSVAMVHYLHPTQIGGTGFFRHSPSGYESINPRRQQSYNQEVQDWIDGNPKRLIDFAGVNTPNYELIYEVPFKFNRAVIYPSYVLHCALYNENSRDDNPKTGRLTLNSFWAPNYQ